MPIQAQASIVAQTDATIRTATNTDTDSGDETDADDAKKSCAGVSLAPKKIPGIHNYGFENCLFRLRTGNIIPNM